MAMNTCFFHIGNPKSYSTSIQQMLFENRGWNFEYIGFSPNQEYNSWFFDEKSRDFLDYDLRYVSNYFFDLKKHDYRNHFFDLFEKAKGKNKDLWISSETSLMRYLLQDQDSTIKFRRMQEVMPPMTTFILIFRNVFDSIKSIYKEYVKQRYCYDFETFCQESYMFRESNYLFGLLPGHTIELLINSLINGNQLKCYFLGSDDGNKNLLNFFNGLVENYKFHHFPKANLSKNKLSWSKQLELNRNSKYFISQSGLIENHRSLSKYRSDNHSLTDNVIWNKLRDKKESEFKELNTNIDFNKDLKIQGSLGDYLKKVKNEDIEKLKIYKTNFSGSITDVWE